MRMQMYQVSGSGQCAFQRQTPTIDARVTRNLLAVHRTWMFSIRKFQVFASVESSSPCPLNARRSSSRDKRDKRDERVKRVNSTG